MATQNDIQTRLLGAEVTMVTNDKSVPVRLQGCSGVIQSVYLDSEKNIKYSVLVAFRYTDTGNWGSELFECSSFMFDMNG